MAKKQVGRPSKPAGAGKAVRLDARLASMARYVAVSRGQSTGDYLESLIGNAVSRDFKALSASVAADKTEGER